MRTCGRLQHHALGAHGDDRLAGARSGGRRQHLPGGARRMDVVIVRTADLGGEEIVFADEARDEQIGRPVVERARRAALLDAALVEDGDPVGHGQRFALVMGDVEHRHPQLAMNAADLVLQLFAQRFVERPQRLVHQHRLRLEHQRPGHRDALLLAAGQLRRAAMAEAFQPHHRQRLLDPRLDFGPPHAAHLEREGEVLRHAHMGEESVVLEHHAQPALVRRTARNVLALQQDRSGRGRLEPGQHHQRRRLAAARRPQQGQELARRDIEVEVAHGGRDAPVIGLADALEAHERRGVGHPRWCFRIRCIEGF